MSVKKKAQVWIEMVLYTLIGLTLIGLALAFATPKINESKDRIIIEQSIEALNSFDEKIIEVMERGSGNVRRVNAFGLKRGELYFYPEEDKIVMVIENLQKIYSEEGVPIRIGSVRVISEEENKRSRISLELDYGGVANITFNDGENLQKFTVASTPYSFIIENKGESEGSIIVNIREN